MENTNMKHKHDYAPIVVGIPSDWYERDSNGEIVLDEKKEPKQNDDLWVAARKNANGWQPDNMCIGGSSASIVAGCRVGHENGCLEDTFSAKLKLYHELRGDVPVAKEDKPEDLFEIGHVFEDAVAVMACRELNETYFGPRSQIAYLVNDQNMYICPVLNAKGELKYPHAIGDMDRVLEVHDKSSGKLIGYYGLEIKTSHYGATKEPKWIKSDKNPYGVPENYETQTRHYMACANLNGFFIAVQEHSMSRQDLLIRYVPRDIELEERILDNEEAFVQDCKNGIEPDDDAPQKALAAVALYTEERQKNEEAIELPEDAAEFIANYMLAKSKIAEIDANYKKSVKPYEDLMADATISLSKFFDVTKKEYGMIKLPDGKTAFVRQNAKRKKGSFDIDRLEREDPVLAQACVKKSVLQTGLKKTQKTDLLQFYIEGELSGALETKINIVEPTTK